MKFNDNLGNINLLPKIIKKIRLNGSKYSCQTGVIVEKIKILIAKNNIINLLFLNKISKIKKLKKEKSNKKNFNIDPLKIIKKILFKTPPPKFDGTKNK